MNPNSAHQTWSRWTATVTVPFHETHAGDAFHLEMRSATARKFRRLFGWASELKIDHELGLTSSRFTVECRTEGAPAQDAVFRKTRMDDIARFFGQNLRRYGQVEVSVDVQIEAGEVEGKPRAQLILGPSRDTLPMTALFGSNHGR